MKDFVLTNMMVMQNSQKKITIRCFIKHSSYEKGYNFEAQDYQSISQSRELEIL